MALEDEWNLHVLDCPTGVAADVLALCPKVQNTPSCVAVVPCCLYQPCCVLQSREPLAAGLVESLRLTPPRSAPHHPTDLSRRLWSIAKAYWMQAGATTAAAAQQQLLAGALAAQGVRGGQALLGSAGGKGGPALGPLLAQLQAKGGGALTKQQLAAAQALVASRGEDQLRRTAVVSALWGMASIGGPLFFQQEMDALCRVGGATVFKPALLLW